MEYNTSKYFPPKKLYYQPDPYPTHKLAGLYMPGGNRKVTSDKGKLPGRVERNGKLYIIVHNKNKKMSLKEVSFGEDLSKYYHKF